MNNIAARLQSMLSTLGHVFQCDEEIAEQLVSGGLALEDDSYTKIFITYESDEIIVRYGEYRIRESKIKFNSVNTEEADDKLVGNIALDENETVPELESSMFKTLAEVESEKSRFKKGVDNVLSFIKKLNKHF